MLLKTVEGTKQGKAGETGSGPESKRIEGKVSVMEPR